MKDNKIKIGDWVRVLKIGMEGMYEVESIENDNYTVVQREGTWSYRLTLKINEISKS